VARLRGQPAAHLSRVRAATAPADGIVVVTGGTQALTISARALAGAGGAAINGARIPVDTGTLAG
jgi:DNA-binding transcriptional MocR family regulator